MVKYSIPVVHSIPSNVSTMHHNELLAQTNLWYLLLLYTENTTISDYNWSIGWLCWMCFDWPTRILDYTVSISVSDYMHPEMKELRSWQGTINPESAIMLILICCSLYSKFPISNICMWVHIHTLRYGTEIIVAC